MGGLADKGDAPAATGDSGLEFRRQIALLQRWRGLFAATAGGVLGAVLLVIVLIPDRYGATADVEIEGRPERAAELNPVLPDLAADPSAVDTEVEVMKSRPLAERVAAALALDHDPEFNPALRPAPWRRMAEALASHPKPSPMETATDRLMRRTSIARVGFTAVIAVSAHARQPQDAARIANAVAGLYLRQQLEARTLASARASDWLGARLGGLRAAVESAEEAVERYKADHGLMTVTEAQGSTLPEQEISTLDAELAAARGARAEAEARLAAARNRLADGGQGDDVGEVLNSPVIQDLRKQRDDAAKTLADLQGRYGPRHPEMLKAERQRAALDAQILEETQRVVSNLKVQAEIGRRRSAAVAAALGQAKDDLARANAASVTLKELERNRDSARTLYQSFLDRFKQTSAQAGLGQSDARIVSPARPPSAPDFPNRPVLSAAAALLALMAGLAAAWIADAREDGLYDAGDVERRLALPCLALTPSARFVAEGQREGLAAADPIGAEAASGLAEAIRSLRAGLFVRKGAGAVRILAITSALPGEGKTTTSLALGRTMARSGATTVVVDCDVRRRTLNRLLAQPTSPGLLDVLAETATLDDALIDDGGLALLPLGDDRGIDEAVLESPAAGRLLDVLRRRFAVVLLDTAPVLAASETRAIAARADAVLLLARWRRTPAGAAARALSLLNQAGARVTGAALTQVDLRHLDRRDYAYALLDDPFYRETPPSPDPV